MYDDFLERIWDLATGLGASVSQGGAGIEEQEMIGMIGENSSEYITLVHACIRLAAPFAPISCYSTPFELKHALNLTKITRLFVDENLLPKVVPVATEVGIDLDHIYVMKGNFNGRKSFWSIINDVRRKKIPRVDVRPATKNTLAYFLFSSGTSGLPKAVMISHGNIIFALGQMKTIAEMANPVVTSPEGKSMTLAFLPLHHTYGLFVYCFRSTLWAGTLALLSKWDIDVALRAIPKYKVSVLMLIPSVVHQLINHPGVEKRDFSSVSVIRCGAAYLPPEMSQKLVSLAPKEVTLLEGYGMSELTIGAISQAENGSLNGTVTLVPGSTGILYPSMEARIVRDDGTDAKTNETGELWLRGDNVALGYWNNGKASKETFVDGWVHTGDKFRVDADGNFWYADRAKDILKVSGAQVSPVEIENCLLQHPGNLINDVTVAGVSGGRISDEKAPRAWIVLTPGGKERGVAAVVKELEVWHKNNLSKYKWLRGGIQVVDEIPKSPTGKVLRRVLQDRYEANAKKLNVKL